MGIFSFKLPDLGEGIVESEVTDWYVKPGDQVEEDQHIADVTTDKAIVEISSPVTGTVISVACDAGEVLAVGRELIRFEVEVEGEAEGNDSEANKSSAPVAQAQNAAPEPQQNASTQAPVAIPKHEASALIKEAPLSASSTSAKGNVLASPSVRQRARDEQIDLKYVPGSGPAGRISHKDLDAFVAAGGQLAVANGRRPKTGHNTVKIRGLRRVIAEKMQQSKRNIPHYSYIEEVDLTQLDELRAYMNSNRTDQQPKLTLLPFIMQALVKLLPQFPHCNAHFDDGENVLTEYEAVHLGIATMTDNGLTVPVVRHVESLDIWQSAAEISRLSQAVRSNNAKPNELSGSTITITSLGAIGGIATTPIINAPETAIIGINKLQERPMVVGGAIVVRKMMNISASFDHRIVDGFDGAQLIQGLKKLLENPAAIFV